MRLIDFRIKAEGIVNFQPANLPHRRAPTLPMVHPGPCIRPELRESVQKLLARLEGVENPHIKLPEIPFIPGRNN